MDANPPHSTNTANDTANDAGLSAAQAAARLAQDGPNELPVSQPRSRLRLVAQIASEPMLLLLLACGGTYLVLGDRQGAVMVLGFLVLVMGISFVQQRRSERSMDALRDLSSPRAIALRDGQPLRLAARDLVVGDRVFLAEGDRVPADLRLLLDSHFAVDESLLTGESAPVVKTAATQSDAGRVFSGTLVTRGTATGCVEATGARSALGRLGQSLAGIASEPTPIQMETRKVVKGVAWVGLALAIGLMTVHGLRTGEWRQGLLSGLTFAMAILPEELPVVLSLFLGLGAWRLARIHVLARSMPAVELLGATTVLCVDKTGTLTANRMRVRRLWSPQSSHDCSETVKEPLPEALHGVLEHALLASHRRAFDPMETAIGQAAQLLLAGTEHLHQDWTLLEDYPLAPDMLAMSRVWQAPDQNARLIASKGAPEAIIDLCHLDAIQSAAILAQVSEMAKAGLRVLGVAWAQMPGGDLPARQHDFDFVFLGLIALEDPLRPHVREAIAQCRAAGIRVVMMTGDHPATATSVAQQAGIPTDAPAITGTELAQMSEGALKACLPHTTVFCRVLPDQKLRLVQALQAMGEVVAMTGDGVNDAPALKAAHIGVAMGEHGTEVAREAAALVLMHDDFSSLVQAVRQGRRVFANLRKAIVFVVAVHVPIVGLTLLPELLGWPALLMPVHILFLQLIIDPACSVVFEAEPLEAHAMTEPPRPAHQMLFDRGVMQQGLWQGAGLLLILLGIYAGARAWLPPGQPPHDSARALSFAVLVVSNLGLIRVNRGAGPTAWWRHTRADRPFGLMALATLLVLLAVLGLAPMRQLFAFAAPPSVAWLAALGGVLVAWLWFEGVKRLTHRVPTPPR